MKSLIFIMTLIISFSVFAEKKAPTFSCLETTGFSYKFYNEDFNEIEVYDEKGNFVSTIDGISSSVSFLETYPKKTKYSFKYDDGNEIATITFIGNQIIGLGQMIDNDSLMSCIKN